LSGSAVCPRLENWRVATDSKSRYCARSTSTRRISYCATRGLILRVRQESGRFVQTVKAARNTNIAARIELNADVPSGEVAIDAIDDRKLRRAVKAAAKKDQLLPLFAVEVRRAQIELTPKRGITIEASLDLGTIKALGPKAGAT